MNIKIGRKTILTAETIILYLLLFMVFVVQWLGISFYFMLIIDGVMFTYIISKYTNSKKSVFAIIMLFVYILYFGFHLMFYGANVRILINNFYVVTSSVLVIIGMSSLYLNRLKIEDCYRKLFFVVNGYMVLNIPVLILQLNNHFELSGRHLEEHTNNFKPDLISGLFGYNGTNMLAAFSAFFFIYDLWYFRTYVKRRHRISFLIYYIVMLAFYLYISIPNDNKGFYILLTLFYIIYFFTVQDNYKKIAQKIKGIIKGLGVIILFMIAFIYAYNHYDPLVELVERFFRVFNNGIRSKYAYGGAERFAIVNYFWSSNISKLFGKGMGTMKWRQELGFGFYHFGQNDLGPFLLLGGLVLILLLIAIFYNCVSSMNKSRFISVCETFCLCFLILYTQIFTSISVMISMMLFVGLCGVESNKRYKNRSLPGRTEV